MIRILNDLADALILLVARLLFVPAGFACVCALLVLVLMLQKTVESADA